MKPVRRQGKVKVARFARHRRMGLKPKYKPNNKPNGGVKMKLCRWNELSEEAKRRALEKYGNEKIDEWVLKSDSWFDEYGFIVEY